MKDYLPRAEKEFVAWVQNFLSRAEEYGPELGLTAADLERMQIELARVIGAMQNAETLRLAAQAATREKNDAIDILEQDIRRTVDSFQRRETVTDTMRAGLQVTIPDTGRSRTSPNPPKNLVVELQPDMGVHAEWDANGNIQNTQYIVEMMAGVNGTWQRLDVVTRRSFTYYGAPLGEQLTFRVIARRHGEESGSSNLATIGA